MLAGAVRTAIFPTEEGDLISERACNLVEQVDGSN
jgi:hypothetical protein